MLFKDTVYICVLYNSITNLFLLMHREEMLFIGIQMEDQV